MRLTRSCFTTLLALTLAACGTKRVQLPESLIDQAEVPGGSTARMWGDELPNNIGERIKILEQQFGNPGGSDVFNEAPLYLAISGGGSNGAFGAGLLKGWSEAGTRPEFHIVSGVSTGALIAPFAFLGSDYDEDLEALYTSLSTDDLVAGRHFIRGLLSDALFDTNRLQGILVEVVDRSMISDIAREYNRGRRLVIATTNIEAQRPVLWNIGAIATIGTEESDQLIRDVMLASASIPGVFPPVRIKVQAGGREYEELHVDGGVSTQVIIYPAQVDLQRAADSVGATDQTQTIYVIRNGYLDARWASVDLKITSLLFASLDTIIRTQGLGDLYRIYLGALRDNAEYRLAYVPPEFTFESEEFFDPVYMRKLFDFAYEQARNGYPWAESPPGFVRAQ